MPRLSILIPWTGPVGPFEDTLAAVLQNRPHGCEVLVALNQPYNDPYQLADEVTFLPPCRRAQDPVALINSALGHATAPIIQILPSGCLVEESWASAALLQFDAPEVGAVAPVLQHPAKRQSILGAGIDYSAGGVRTLAHAGARYDVTKLVQSRPLGAPWTGGFFRRSVVDALGGFDTSVGEAFADIDMALAMHELGLRTECEPTSVILTTQPQSPRGSFSAGLQAERLFRKHCPHFEADKAVAAHRGQLWSEALWSLIQPWWMLHLAGRWCGSMGRVAAAAHDARLTLAKERLVEQEAPCVLKMPMKTLPSPQRRAA